MVHSWSPENSLYNHIKLYYCKEKQKKWFLSPFLCLPPCHHQHLHSYAQPSYYRTILPLFKTQLMGFSLKQANDGFLTCI